MFLLFFFLNKRQKKNSSNFQGFAVFFWNKELLFLYFYKTADQFVFSCLKQKHFNKKKHQQYLHLTFLLAFPKCNKKNVLFCLTWNEKKRTQKAKNNAFGQRVRKRRQRFKSLSSWACWQETKIFFSHVFILLFSLRYLFWSKNKIAKKKKLRCCWKCC